MICLASNLILFYVLSFLTGICVTSMINVVIWRVPQALSIVKRKSFCPACVQQSAWYDRIPIVSYVLRKGKCRYCGTNIPCRDTILEVIGGLIAMLCFHHFMFTWNTIVVFSIFIILLAITLIDLDTMTIPNGLIIALLIPIGMMTVIQQDVSIISRSLGFFIISLPMYLLIFMIPDCFGGGDVKLIAVCGFLLGWKSTLLAGFIAVILGGAYAAYALVSGKVKKGAHIAFGPYLAIGIAIALLYGREIIEFYMSLFVNRIR